MKVALQLEVIRIQPGPLPSVEFHVTIKGPDGTVVQAMGDFTLGRTDTLTIGPLNMEAAVYFN